MTLDSDLYINLYDTCKLVKGEKRGTITDLQRGNLELVPNELIDTLIDFNGKKISGLYTHGYSKEDLEIVEEYFRFLIDKEIIFLSGDKVEFYSNNVDFDSPKDLVSAIIDVDKKSFYNLAEAIHKINRIGCDNLQLRLYDCEMEPENLQNIVSLFDNTSFRYVEILLKYHPNFNEKYHEIFKNSHRVALVYFHSYEGKDKVEEVDTVKYIYTSQKIISSDFCGYILPFYFDISPITYFIGEKYNTCLYKKIAIDVDGNIKNCPSMRESFGKIDKADIQKIINDSKFQKYWDITKDKISICKSCEFRKVCTDCRAYLHEDQLYEKPKYCSYDPKNPNW